MIDEIPGTYRPQGADGDPRPLNEALKAGRISSRRLRGLTVPADKNKRAVFTFATDEQPEIMAASHG